ncbi:hypothetical protein NKJ26_29070 [Mesorhizobium sp. M0152]|uniref:hypothetical protein n=1 Tax=Mesorhizobium sp. M0152 TaxID=2956898 RepID=UPI00333BBE55
MNSSTTPSGLAGFSARILSDPAAFPAPANAEKASATAANHSDLREAMTIPIPAGGAGFFLIAEICGRTGSQREVTLR